MGTSLGKIWIVWLVAWWLFDGGMWVEEWGCQKDPDGAKHAH